MSRGWAKGTKEFKKAVSEDLKDEDLRKIVEAEASKLRKPRWKRSLARGLALLERGEPELRECRKGELWKVALALWLRETHLAPNGWIARRLSMGTRDEVSSLISRHPKLLDERSMQSLKNHEWRSKFVLQEFVDWCLLDPSCGLVDRRTFPADTL